MSLFLIGLLQLSSSLHFFNITLLLLWLRPRFGLQSCVAVSFPELCQDCWFWDISRVLKLCSLWFRWFQREVVVRIHQSSLPERKFLFLHLKICLSEKPCEMSFTYNIPTFSKVFVYLTGSRHVGEMKTSTNQGTLQFLWNWGALNYISSRKLQLVKIYQIPSLHNRNTGCFFRNLQL